MLNDRQVAFCLEYVKNGLNAKRAYETAYGQKNGDSAQSAGSRLLSHVEVSNRIQKVYRERRRRSEIKAEDVIQGIAQVAFSDPRKLLNDDGTLKNLADLDEVNQRMEKPENRAEMKEQRQQLEKTRQEMNKAAEQMQKGQLSQAISSSTRAQKDLQEMRDDLREKTSSQFSEEMRNMRRA